MSDEDHKEDAANYVAGGMRCGKTLVMENAKLKESLRLAENDCKVTAGISAERLEKMDALKAEVKKLKEDLSASEANIATLESEDTDAMKERDRLFTVNHVNERLIKQFCEAALAPVELNTTTPERAVEIVADMRAETAKLKAALATINEIRNSIIGLGTVNWSEHIYPLVDALDKAGFKGKGWPEAFNYCGTMRERTLKAEECLVVLKAEHAADAILLEVIQDEINLHDWGRYTTLARRKSEEAAS